MSEKILIVDDEKGIRSTLRAILEDEGFRVDAVESGERCLEVVREKEYDLILLDVWLKEMDGLAVLAHLKEENYPALVVMISGHATIETAVTATRLGAWDFIEKPLSLEKTVLVVNNALRQRKLERENAELIRQLHEPVDMVGSSRQMKELKHQIKLAAPTDSTVLILGEHGTGKELVARAIHIESARSEAPFVEVNCAAIPEELIESELFGHIKGSFTGASEDKMGKFKAADGGTLFLDEIGDMSMKTQAKVLRALQEQTIEPVGAQRSLQVNVRVIAATNKDLEVEIKSGNFRSDLYFRINVIPVYVPPLRQRADDIPLLVEHFLRVHAARIGKKPKKVAENAMRVIRSYEWPGNVRELRNLMERMMIMVEGETIENTDLQNILPVVAGGREMLEGIPSDFESLKEAREFFEKYVISETLKRFEFNVADAAKALQLERSHLYRKIKTYGISTSDK